MFVRANRAGSGKQTNRGSARLMFSCEARLDSLVDGFIQGLDISEYLWFLVAAMILGTGPVPIAASTKILTTECTVHITSVRHRDMWIDTNVTRRHQWWTRPPHRIQFKWLYSCHTGKTQLRGGFVAWTFITTSLDVPTHIIIHRGTIEVGLYVEAVYLRSEFFCDLLWTMTWLGYVAARSS